LPLQPVVADRGRRGEACLDVTLLEQVALAARVVAPHAREAIRLQLLTHRQRVGAATRGRQPGAANALSVRQELQADCFAGVWARNADQARHIMEEGDLEEAIGAAAAVGDDRLQRQAQGRIAPDTFTHGSSTQRVRWFKRGFDSGTINQCDTFRAEQL